MLVMWKGLWAFDGLVEDSTTCCGEGLLRSGVRKMDKKNQER